MREVNRSALVPYSAEQMFALVDDVERYPQFVPWVKSAQILKRTDQFVEATLEMVRAGLHERFTTRNTRQACARIDMELVEGPFRHLEGTWTFAPIETNGVEHGSRINLHMRFEFKNAVLGLMLSKTFDASCNSLVDAFAQRARALYAKQPGVTI